jgi:hypothetical protein
MATQLVAVLSCILPLVLSTQEAFHSLQNGKLECTIFPRPQPNAYRDSYGLDILFKFPDVAQIVSKILSFEPLSEYNNGVGAGKIKLLNGTVLEVAEVSAGTSFKLCVSIGPHSQIILTSGYRRNTFLSNQ